MITRGLLRPLSAGTSSWMCPSCVRYQPSILHAATNSLIYPTQRTQTSSFLRTAQTPFFTRQFADYRYDRPPPLEPPSLGNVEEHFREKGVPGLLSPIGYQLAWTTYQSMMIGKLNALCAGEPYEGQQPKKLLLRFARDPMNASLFNHASMAFNNQFFFSTLSPSPQPLNQQAALRDSLIKSFGSIETLKMTMLDTASAMFGPGFVWLVWAQDVPKAGQTRKFSGVASGDWRILTTYMAGTPFPEAGYRFQGRDMSTSDVSNSPGSFGRLSTAGSNDPSAGLPPGASRVMPALCINTWEHVWIYDCGLNGKETFLRDWWDAIDWSLVATHVDARIFEHVR